MNTNNKNKLLIILSLCGLLGSTACNVSDAELASAKNKLKDAEQKILKLQNEAEEKILKLQNENGELRESLKKGGTLVLTDTEKEEIERITNKFNELLKPGVKLASKDINSLISEMAAEPAIAQQTYAKIMEKNFELYEKQSKGPLTKEEEEELTKIDDILNTLGQSIQPNIKSAVTQYEETQAKDAWDKSLAILKPEYEVIIKEPNLQARMTEAPLLKLLRHDRKQVANSIASMSKGTQNLARISAVIDANTKQELQAILYFLKEGRFKQRDDTTALNDLQATIEKKIDNNKNLGQTLNQTKKDEFNSAYFAFFKIAKNPEIPEIEAGLPMTKAEYDDLQALLSAGGPVTTMPPVTTAPTGTKKGPPIGGPKPPKPTTAKPTTTKPATPGAKAPIVQLPDFPANVPAEGASDQEVKEYLAEVIKLPFVPSQGALQTELNNMANNYDTKIVDKKKRDELIDIFTRLENSTRNYDPAKPHLQVIAIRGAVSDLKALLK